MTKIAQHIPDTFEQMVRYYGAYSARSRGVKTTQYDEPIIIPLSQMGKKLSLLLAGHLP